MPDLPNHLTPDEQRRLDEIRAAVADLRKERDLILTRARVRKHRQP